MRLTGRHLRTLAPFVLLTVGGAYALASWDWCGPWEGGEPVVEHAVRAEGELQAGVARADISPPFPVVPAGYGPLRPDLTSTEGALRARALVLEVADVRVAIVSLDALSAPASLVEAIRQRAAALEFDGLWVTATHAHSSLGGYDERFVAQLAGMGSFREEVQTAIVDAAVAALTSARAKLEPATLQVGVAEAGALVRNRSGDAPDPRLTRVRLATEAGPLAELWIFSAHATLVSRPVQALSPDYPGLLEADGVPVILLQGAVGNASAVVPEGEGAAHVRYAGALSAAAKAIGTEPVAATALASSRVRVPLPRPDASRLAPSYARAAGDNLLCTASDETAVISALRMGTLTLVAIPAEASSGAARVIEARTGASRLVSVANGYLGYLEPGDVAARGEGESLRQYYAPALHEILTGAAERAVGALAP